MRNIARLLQCCMWITAFFLFGSHELSAESKACKTKQFAQKRHVGYAG